MTVLSASIINIGTGVRYSETNPNVPMGIASVGKLLLLSEYARQIATGAMTFGEPLHRSCTPLVGGDGLWQHMQVKSLPAGDVAALIGAVSDNWATNVLLERIGLDAVERRTEQIGLEHTRLHDLVRDNRDGTVPPRIATGTTGELALLMRTLWDDHDGTGRLVLGWIAGGYDLSMVPAVFKHDPLGHMHSVDGVRIWSKTGTDVGVRCDTGIVHGPFGAVAYSATVNWEPADRSGLEKSDGWMQTQGVTIRQAVTS